MSSPTRCVIRRSDPTNWRSTRSCAQTVRTGIAALPPKHRSVVALYYLDGLSLQETAEALGIRLGTVKSRLHYALDTLRRELGRRRFRPTRSRCRRPPAATHRDGGRDDPPPRGRLRHVHRPALVDFVEHRALGPDSPAALDHLARCVRV